MPVQLIKIELLHDSRGTVLVGEHDVSNDVRSLRLDAEVGEPTRVELELVAHPVVFGGDAEITLSPATRAMLKASGWTPPARPSDAEMMTGRPAGCTFRQNLGGVHQACTLPINHGKMHKDEFGNEWFA